MSVCIYTCECRCQRVQKRAADPLELWFQGLHVLQISGPLQEQHMLLSQLSSLSFRFTGVHSSLLGWLTWVTQHSECVTARPLP